MAQPNEDERRYQLAIGFIPKVGPALTKQLIAHVRDAKSIFEAPVGKLAKVQGVGPAFIENLRKHKDAALKEADRVLNQAMQDGDRMVWYTDPDYPDRLKLAEDAPTLFFYRGNADLNAAKIVSIVGTRRATEYGKQVTEDIVKELAVRYNDAIVVSGLAFGIDIIAHRAALTQGLNTIGVMATGLDQIYPGQHRSTALQMVGQGGLITEHNYGTKVEAHFFPARNRIIAALSDAVIVVEAYDEGGALITANLGDSYNRPVLAVPGPIYSAASIGCNALIAKQKALIYSQFEDLEKALNWDVIYKSTPNALIPTLSSLPLEQAEKQVLGFLIKHNDPHVDIISRGLGFSMNQLATLLLNLEFAGYVKPLPGKKYAPKVTVKLD